MTSAFGKPRSQLGFVMLCRTTHALMARTSLGRVDLAMVRLRRIKREQIPTAGEAPTAPERLAYFATVYSVP